MNSQLEDYICAHIDAEPENLYRLYRRVNTSLLYPRMCSGHLQGRVLKMLTQMINPLRVLEIGTYAGYSSLCIAEGLLNPDATFDTIEIDDEMEEWIRSEFAASPYGSRINLHIGDAREIIPRLGAPWDMVYIDANKRLYCDFYRLVMPYMHPGAYILVDNTLWDAKVMDLDTNHDAQTRGIADFNDLIAADSRVEKVILPMRDGLTIIRIKD